ncbi:MAG: DNA-3-methyladenine glycosylase I [Acidobacteriota bacterium]|nr:DNA-3-methyladenine glycosylase I [Acidobacteriota bacterium]
MNRCWWCEGDPIYEAYHDEVWGKPEHDDRNLFKMLVLEHFQSGLSWITILRKEDHFQRAFADWDPAVIAAFGEEDIARLLQDAGIIRNRKKIEAAINNAQICLEIVKEEGSLDRYFWSFAPKDRPVPKGGFTRGTLPNMIEDARVMSKALKKRGFKFTGPMVCMSFMQAVGMINDHVKGCDLCIY